MKRTTLCTLLLFLLSVVACNETDGPLAPSSDGDVAGQTSNAGSSSDNKGNGENGPPGESENQGEEEGQEEEGTEGPVTTAETELVCQTLDFEGLSDNEIVTSLSLFDFTVSVDVDPQGEQQSCATGTIGVDCDAQARIFDSSLENRSPNSDPDLTYTDGPDADGVGGVCADCRSLDLGNLLIIQQDLDFSPPDALTDPNDSQKGGRITFSGFTGNGTFQLQEFKAIDDDGIEPVFIARVDGTTELAPTSATLTNGSVQTVTITTPHTFSDKFSIEYGGSGATDEIVVCREEEVPSGGGQGCTPGYWRQPHHYDSWMDYAPGQLFETVFDLPAGLERPEHDVVLADLTLGDAVQLRGGGVNALIRHAVAALLNAAHPDVSYDLSTSDVIEMFNDAIGVGGDIDGTKDVFEGFNEQGCPLN